MIAVRGRRLVAEFVGLCFREMAGSLEGATSESRGQPAWYGDTAR